MKNVDIKEENISESLSNTFKEKYLNDKKNACVRHSLIKNSIVDVVYDNKNEIDTTFIFSNEVKTTSL